VIPRGRSPQNASFKRCPSLLPRIMTKKGRRINGYNLIILLTPRQNKDFAGKLLLA
ncbi:unnamed protein product, partial [marine sediment metagenome]